MPGGKPDPLIRHQHGHIGKPLSRIDGPLKVSGAAPFAAEFPIDGMVYAALAFSTIAKGRIVDDRHRGAEAAPGVVARDDASQRAAAEAAAVFLSAPKAAGGDNLPVMQDDRIHWNGQPIAVVLAETQEQADHAKSLIRATYEAEPALTAFARGQGERHASRACSWASRSQMKSAMRRRRWRPRRSRSMRPTARRATTTTPSSSHAVTVAWEATRCASTTPRSWSRIPPGRSRRCSGSTRSRFVITSPFVGGGFGGKCLWQHQVLAAAAAKLAGRPVRIVLSREGVYRIVGGRTPDRAARRARRRPDGSFKR